MAKLSAGDRVRNKFKEPRPDETDAVATGTVSSESSDLILVIDMDAGMPAQWRGDRFQGEHVFEKIA